MQVYSVTATSTCMVNFDLCTPFGTWSILEGALEKNMYGKIFISVILRQIYKNQFHEWCHFVKNKIILL
jgi:hypothetical protein